jgi:hypothetical protein
MKSIIAISVSALLSLGNLAQAKCVACADHKDHAKTIPVHPKDPAKLVKLNAGEGFIVTSTLKEVPSIRVSSLQFIEELGKTYLRKCRENNIGQLPFVIMSAGNTEEMVNETPLKSTAVKISWTRFGKDEIQSQEHLNTLIEALMDMRDRETCFVKFDSREAGFRVLVNEANADAMQSVARK